MRCPVDRLITETWMFNTSLREQFCEVLLSMSNTQIEEAIARYHPDAQKREDLEKLWDLHLTYGPKFLINKVKEFEETIKRNNREGGYE